MEIDWEWFSDPVHVSLLMLTGGAFAWIVDKAWTIFTHFDKKPPNPSKQDIEDIVGETLAQESSKQQKIEMLSQALGIRDQAVASFFHTLEEKELPPERWADTLAEIAQRHLHLIAEVRVLHANDPAVRRLRDEALAALEKGDNAKAEEALTSARALVRAARQRLTQALAEQAIEEARIEGTLGTLAMKQLRYLAAAQHYAAAAGLMPPGHDDERLGYLDQEVVAYYRQGEEFGDNQALLTAIERYCSLLDARPREHMPLQWAGTQNDLGIALTSLGERETGAARLQQAVTAFREALAVFTREGKPRKWAMIQNNLGGVLLSLGMRESEPARLQDAVHAFCLALTEYTHERAPLDWAMTQNNLGNALSRLGEREAGTARLEKAVAAYREALKERTQDRMPLDWAMTQNNLSVVLRTLGERRNDRECLEKAVTACWEALKEYTRERVPLDWAMTQMNLGNALQCLGKHEADTTRLKEAVAAYREALKERTRERVPLDWALTQNNLGYALLSLGGREGDPARLEEAVAAVRSALEVFEQAGATYYVGFARDNFGRAQDLLRQRRGGG